MDVHIRDLRYFVAAAEEEHITRAASRLFVSQPAMSKQIRTLEQHLGVDLLQRHPRGVTLTEQGRVLLPRARDLVAAWDAAVREVRATASAGTIVIGMQTAVGRGLQRHAFAMFRERAPGWVPSLRLVPWDDPTAGLADASSDVAFVWMPLLPEDGYDWMTVREERRFVAMTDDHVLADRDVVDLDELLDEPFVALPSAAGRLRDFWLARDDRGGGAPVIGAVAATADAALDAVAGGQGVVLIAEGNTDLYVRPGVITRPVRGLGPATLVLAWRSDEQRRVVADFVAAVEDAIDRL